MAEGIKLSELPVADDLPIEARLYVQDPTKPPGEQSRALRQAELFGKPIRNGIRFANDKLTDRQSARTKVTPRTRP